MVEMIDVLLKNKNAYEKNSHVYFDVSSFKDYGKLSNKNIDELKAGARVEVSENKKNPKILYCGSHLIKMSQVGAHLGAKEDLVGI